MVETAAGPAAAPLGGAGRAAAALGVLGPAVFVGGWALAGALRPGYSPVHDAISQLARLGAPRRALMTGAFLGFGLSMPVFGRSLAAALGGDRALEAAVALAGAATVCVAAFPLSAAGGGPEDLAHGAFAVLGYVATAASPLLGARALRRTGRHRAALASLVVGALSAASLSATAFSSSPGLFQRAGLGVVDLWYAVVALALVTGSLTAREAR